MKRYTLGLLDSSIGKGNITKPTIKYDERVKYNVRKYMIQY